MNLIQERLNDNGEYVAPSSDGKEKEKRVLVRISEKKVAALYQKPGTVFDHAAISDHDAYALKVRVLAVVDEFFGRRK